MTRRAVLDTDLAMGAPGSDIDDGFALALALADPEVDVELVTTVGGNTDVATATRLSRELLERLGRPDIPVVRGAASPCRYPTFTWDSDTSNGLEPIGSDAQPLEVRAENPATGEIVDRVMAAPGEITVVAIGPLSNVAAALVAEPRVATAVREVVVMGGVYLGQTNLAVMPGEFNFWADPSAAAIVLGSGAPLRLVGLDVTRRVRLTREHAAAMAAGGRAFGAFAGACTLGWIDHVERHLPGDESERGSCAMHDPLAVAVVTRPDLVTWRRAYVQVETSSALTRGVAIADLLTSVDPPAANCEIAVDVDVAGFMEVFLARVGAL